MISLKKVELYGAQYEWKKRSDYDDEVMLYIDGKHVGNFVYSTKQYYAYNNGKFVPKNDFYFVISPPGIEDKKAKQIKQTWKI